MANRNVEKLIVSWVAADFSRRHYVPENSRGYNLSYGNPDMERQRATEEAEAAASLARQILAERSS